MDHLLDGQHQTISCGRGILGILLHLHEGALCVLHYYRGGIDAGDRFDIPPTLTVAFEADRVAFHQQLQDHVLDEGRERQPVMQFDNGVFDRLIIAGQLDLVPHRKAAPGVDAVFHQRLLDVIRPRSPCALLPGHGDRIGGRDTDKRRTIDGGGARLRQRLRQRAGGLRCPIS